MSYTTITVVIDGALESEESFPESATALDAFIVQVEKDAAEHGLFVEVYELFHDHDETGEACACVQYLTDHRPDYTFNTDAE